MFIKSTTLLSNKIIDFITLFVLFISYCISDETQVAIDKKTHNKLNNFSVEIHSRVDTTKAEIKEIAILYSNYLNSYPDKISDNPYWNEKEKKLYRDFDFSQSLLFQFPSENLLNYFKPKILSIEKEGLYYSIRTIFSAEGLDGDYRKSNPWAIHKLFAIKENNQWRLINSLPVITASWNKKTVGKITFIYPNSHIFNLDLALKANEFCNRLKEEYKFTDYEPFEYYITNSGDELGRLLNFDFFFAGYTTGMGLNEKRILFSGFGTEYYPHEFVHLILPKFDRLGLIEEGFATWKGGQGGKSFEESSRIFANELAKNDTITFSDILNKKWGWQYAAYYTTGAILCNLAYEKGGVDLVIKILQVPKGNDNAIANLSQIFDINESDFSSFVRKEVLKFKNK
jgi:hypothetical protein